MGLEDKVENTKPACLEGCLVMGAHYNMGQVDEEYQKKLCIYNKSCYHKKIVNDLQFCTYFNKQK